MASRFFSWFFLIFLSATLTCFAQDSSQSEQFDNLDEQPALDLPQEEMEAQSDENEESQEPFFQEELQESSRDEMAASKTPKKSPGDVVVLQGLDKVTARVFRVSAKLNERIDFGTLRILVRKCYKSDADKLPESAAFLEIREIKQNELPRKVFSGWMFASSPGLSALEHPVYDVQVKECFSNQTSMPQSPSKEAS